VCVGKKNLKNQIMYSFLGSLVKHPHPVRGGACSIPGRSNIFKLVFSPSQDEKQAVKISGAIRKIKPI
jgi:hypothetical protein